MLVVDDQRSFADLLGIALDGEADLTCIGKASTGAEALAAAESMDPDVVLMDVRLPDADGIDVARRLRSRNPEARVVILTALPDLAALVRAAAVGVAGFVPKDVPATEVLAAVRRAGDGGMVVDPRSLAELLREIPRSGALQVDAYRLTPREHEVLGAMATGLDAKAIARSLGISISTCRGHIKAILGKLGAHSQLEAVVRATENGMVHGH